MKYNIREMTIDDINEVVEGEKKVFSESLGYDLLYTDLVLNPYSHYFVLEVDNILSGYIGLWIDETAQIVNFYIEPKYQNLGFGSMLLAFVLDLCAMSKVENLSLEVRVSNAKAIRLYKKFGFTQINIRKAYYKDGEDAFVMNKSFKEKLGDLK